MTRAAERLHGHGENVTVPGVYERGDTSAARARFASVAETFLVDNILDALPDISNWENHPTHEPWIDTGSP
jgi:hypothetical protein